MGVRELKEQLSSASKEIWENAKERIEEDGFFDPVIILLYEDDRREFLYPRYGSEDERREAFQKVNRHIRETKAIGAVMAMETWFFPKTTHERKEAILITRSGWGVKEHEAWTFGRDGSDNIVWKDHMEPQGALSRGFITAFEEVH